MREKETNSGDKRPEDVSVSGRRTEDAIKRRFWIDRDGSGAENTLNVQLVSFSIASRVSLSSEFEVNILKVTKKPKRLCELGVFLLTGLDRINLGYQKVAL